jgi:predicted nucleotide-binding protein (sugar kinase/HSP70/actin superfamily)
MDEILIPSNFERKRQILKKICKKENISDHEQLLNSIKFVQDIRNKSAHGERFFDFTKQIKIQKRKIGGSLQEDFELTDELMEDIEQQTTYILKRLGELAVEFRKPHLDSLKE